MDEKITNGELELRIEKVYGDPATEIQSAEILRRCSLLRSGLQDQLRRTDPNAIVTFADQGAQARFKMTCSGIEPEALLALVSDHLAAHELADRKTILVAH